MTKCSMCAALLSVAAVMTGCNRTEADSVPVVRPVLVTASLEENEPGFTSKIRAGPVAPREAADILTSLRIKLSGDPDLLWRKDFYFDGQATSCGAVVKAGEGLHYVSRNGWAILQDAVTPEDFGMFWELCRAAGAESG